MSEAEKAKKEKEELLKQAYERGFRYERKYAGCAQSVLLAIQETFGIEDPAVFKSASGLAGGMGLTIKGPCGGLTGGIMALSQKYGRERSKIEDTERVRFKSYELARKLCERFIDEYGSCICRDVQRKVLGRAYDLSDPREYQEFEKAGGHAEKCPLVVGKAASWVTEIILEQEGLG
jgi:C_GCAxxG_C_C family probable redox protein